MKAGQPKRLFRARRSAPPDPVAALAAIAESGGRCTMENGEVIPRLIPRREYDDHMDFDREVCAAGVTDFLRPAMPSDFPSAMASESPHVPRDSHVRVRGRSRLRVREFIAYFPLGSLN